MVDFNINADFYPNNILLQLIGVKLFMAPLNALSLAFMAPKSIMGL